MPRTILVTGGAGFIGSHVVDRLVAAGERVRVIDALLPQVHGEGCSTPRFLPSGVEFLHANLCDPDACNQALDGCEVVVHLAADVGVGQSMYEITRYVRNNTLATGVLLEAMLARRGTIKRVVVASSMSIYGEGAYRCEACGPVFPEIRSLAQLESRNYEPACPRCRLLLAPVPTTEEKPLKPTSIYAVNKRDQEEMCLAFGQAYDIPTTALRFFNVYGPRQALSNPYTGVVAIFGSRLLNRRSPRIFEDGRQCRDFVHVSDIVQAIIQSVQSKLEFGVFNVGTGRAISIAKVAQILAGEIGVDQPAEIVNQYRAGDIRHCTADISRIRHSLGYEPRVRFEDGIHELVEWMKGEQAIDRGDQAMRELQLLGLTRGAEIRS